SLMTVFSVQFEFLPWLKNEGIQSNDAAAVANFESKLNMAYIVNTGLLIIIAFVTIVGGIVAFLFSAGAGRPTNPGEDFLSKIPSVGTFITDTAMADSFGIAGRMMG